MNIGDKIAHLRKQADMTQEELAGKLSVTAQAVSKWENGITSPDISLLGILAGIFHITTDELLGIEAPRAYSVTAKENEDLSKLMLKIRVISDEGDKINVNLPMNIITMFLENGQELKFGNSDLSNLDWKMISESIKNGLRGKIVEVNSADGTLVEIVVE